MSDELVLKRHQDLEQIRQQTESQKDLLDFQYDSHYEYQGLAYQEVTRYMDSHPGVHVPATSLRKYNRMDRKRQREADEAMRLAREADEAANLQRADYETSMTKENISTERRVLQLKLAAIDAQSDVALANLSSQFKYQRQQVKVMAAADRAEAYSRYARMLPLESKERADAMKEREKAQIEYSKLKKELSIMQMDKDEAKQEKSTQRKHYWYDVSKDLAKGIYGENPLSKEDAEYIHPVTGHKLINVGRAFFGGTKPMYIFEDRSEPIVVDGKTTYPRFLYKEAINCMGGSTPERAEVTRAAAVLQERICGEFHIPTFTATVNGKIVGTFQSQVTTLSKDAAVQKADEPQYAKVDLFSWQKNPVTDLPQVVTDQVLREHVLDWLLCNFDTKGENFLQREDYRLCSIDKEASFRKILSSDAQHMDENYCPHNNETIYNVIFRKYAAGEMDLNLDGLEEHIRKMEEASGMPDKDFVDLFKPFLDMRFGIDTKDRKKAEENLLRRKQNLRQEYKNFLGRLTRQRLEKTTDPQARQTLQTHLSSDGQYLFRSERPQPQDDGAA